MYERCKNIVLRNIHDTYFLIDITDNYMDDECVLNETNEVGVIIWRMLSKPIEIDEVVHELKKQLNGEIKDDILHSDIEEYIQYLLQLGFIKECES